MANIKLTYPDGKLAPKNITVKEFEKELKKSIYSTTELGQSAPPILIWGAPGIGKTAIVNEVAKEFGFSSHEGSIITQDLATCTEADFMLPAPDADFIDKSTRLPINWLPVYDSSKYSPEEGDKLANGPDGKGGVIFFDEVARCRPSVQNVIMKLCDADRRINQWKLGSKWQIVMSANRQFDGGDSDDTFNWNPTLGNRLTQFNFYLTPSDWLDYAVKNKINKDIIGFINFREDYFHAYDPNEEDINGGKPVIYPSPRKWEDASKQIELEELYCKKFGGSPDLMTVISGQVGVNAATQFIGYIQLKKEVDPESLKQVFINYKKGPKLEKLNIDQQKVILMTVAMTDFDSKDKKTLDNIVSWVIEGVVNPVNGILFYTLVQKFHPELNNNIYWQKDLKNKFFATYPNLTK